MEEFKIVKNELIPENIFKSIMELDSSFYKEEYLWDVDYQKKVYEANKNSLITVMDKNKLIGYINYLVISKDKYEDIKKDNTIIDNYEIEDIKQFSKDEDNYITINSIVIELEYQNGEAIKLLTNAFQKEMAKLNKNGYVIKGISSTAVTIDGNKFLTRLKFIPIKRLEDGNTLYILENEELKKYLNI